MLKTVYGSFIPVLGESRKYKRHTKGTYIGLVAYAIQDSPNKMLPFQQIMKKLEMFVSGDRKALENNIRVCLSSNKCFVKIPIDPEYPNAKRNFWKVDESHITPKMLRRHFSDMVELFPGLSSAWDRKPVPPSVPAAPDRPVKIEDRPIKFTGPFSIESLLKKDHVPQMHVAVQQPAQITASSMNLCCSDHLYNTAASTHSLADLDTENRQRSLYYMYRSVAETRHAPLPWMDLSPVLPHSLLYSPHCPNDQFTNTWNAPQNMHELTYRKC